VMSKPVKNYCGVWEILRRRINRIFYLLIGEIKISLAALFFYNQKDLGQKSRNET
jgi:hypothetical protein